MLALGLGGRRRIAREFARPVRRLDEAARQIASGDLEVRAPVEGSSEQRSLSRSFNEMTDRLSRAIRAQQRFVADASHQLRTPLTGLRLRLEEARASGVSQDAERQLEAGEHEVERLARTIDELLVLSRAGEHDAPGEVVDLAQVAEDAVVAGAEPPRSTETSSSWSEARQAPVWAARADLDRALDALVENAVTYSPPREAGRRDLAPGQDRGRGRGAGAGRGRGGERCSSASTGPAGARPAGTGLGLPIARELPAAGAATTYIVSSGVASGGAPSHASCSEPLRALHPGGS